MSPRSQTLFLALLAAILALAFAANVAWDGAYFRLAEEYCGPHFTNRPEGWREKIKAISDQEIWSELQPRLLSWQTCAFLALVFGALLPAACSPLLFQPGWAKRIVIGLPFGLLTPIVIRLTLTTPDPSLACSLFPSLGLAILTLYGLTFFFTLPLLTFAALFLIRRMRGGVSSPPGSD